MPSVPDTLAAVDTWVADTLAPRIRRRMLRWVEPVTDEDGNVVQPGREKFRHVPRTHETTPEHTRRRLVTVQPDYPDSDGGIDPEGMLAAIQIDFINGTEGLVITVFLAHADHPGRIGERRIGWRKGTEFAPSLSDPPVWKIRRRREDEGRRRRN